MSSMTISAKDAAMPGRQPLRRVLCVDDDADIRAITELALSTVGHLDVTMCASGAEALDIAGPLAPDVILLDVMMPGMDGVETLRRLGMSHSTAGIPVVFMTAKAQRYEREAYLDAGAIGVITKPFDPMGLAQDLKALYAGPATVAA